MGTPVEQPVKQARVPGNAAVSQSCRDGCVLPHQDARCRRKEGAQKERQEADFGSAGQNHVGPQAPHQPDEWKRGGACARGAKRMDRDLGGHGAARRILSADQAEMDFEALPGQASRHQRHYLLGAAAANPWSQQENSGSFHNMFPEEKQLSNGSA